MTVEHRHRLGAKHDIPTASCVRRKRRPPPWISLHRATSANRFATQRFSLIADD